ncbi:MAG: hypothetical protein B6I31_00815 [Desulfobacteraceae bacterium 4572_19]|nr:MAG: hypothetical protein B6I31_00815 [Desulfobacteraceae bacterium 4572_19]
MSEVLEQHEWFMKKRPIIDEFDVQVKAITDGFASRGFSIVPGQVYKLAKILELQTKQKLEELNFQITGAAVERELTQQQIDYDLLYKQNAIQWELDKALLLDALERELALAKNARQNREQVLESLAIEVGLRQAVILAAKTLLEIESSEIKKQIVEEQGKTMPKEIELANARLATANEKLKIIPFLQAIMVEEEALIVIETATAEQEKVLIDAKTEQIPVRLDTVAKEEFLLNETDTLTAPLISNAEKKLIVYEGKLSYEETAQKKIDPSNKLVTALSNLNTALEEYTVKRELLIPLYIQKANKMLELVQPTLDYLAEVEKTLPFIQELTEKKKLLIEPSLEKARVLLTLIEPMKEKIIKTKELLKALYKELALKKDIKLIQEEIEELKRVGIEADLAVMAKQLEEGEFRKLVLLAEVALKKLTSINRGALMELDATDVVEYTTIKQEGQARTVEKEKEASTARVDSGYKVSMERLRSSLESVKTMVLEQAGHSGDDHSGSIYEIGKYGRKTKEDQAEIKSETELTSKLIHQIV